MTPSRKAVLLVVIPALMSTLVLVLDTVKLVVLGLDALIMLMLVIDAFTLPRKDQFAAERELQTTFSVGHFYPVTIILSSWLNRDIAVRLNDDRTEDSEVRQLPALVSLPANSRSSWEYRLAFQTRGLHELKTVYVELPSALGLWQRIVQYPVVSAVKVYPDLKKISEYSLLARRNQIHLMGIRRLSKAGGDNEFERLKDYHANDEFRHIAWKATAKQEKLISKSFQVAQNQSVIFMLDCGRMMVSQANALSLLSHSLNATLMLSKIILNNRDSVGLLTFTDRVESYLAPSGGPAQMNRLIQASYNKHPTMAASNYTEALQYLNRVRRKRTLLILITSVIDEDTFGTIEAHLAVLRSRHLPLFVHLRDREVESLVVESPKSEDEFYQTAAASEFLSWRSRRMETMKQKGVLTMDVFPEELTAALINQYLEIKAEHLL